MININVSDIVAKIDETGIHAPDYQTVFNLLSGWFKQIYGDDIYIEPDSKDGQLLAIFAMAIHNSNSNHIGTYRSFSPSTATGEALSSNVKINGISRHKPTYSQADLLLEGQVGTVINDGAVRDANGNLWTFPSAIIGLDGSIMVTATCNKYGAITAQSGSLTDIATPTRGWKSVTNPKPATMGQPVETDAQLRERQQISTALPSRTILSGILGVIKSIQGVKRLRGYDNDTHITDSNGIPPHSISLVIEGGDGQAIANAIAVKKSFGGTYGDQQYTYTDEFGTIYKINFFRPSIIPIHVKIVINPLTGYTTSTGESIKDSIANYINMIKIGEPVRISRLFSAASCAGTKTDNDTYDIQSLLIGTSLSNLQASNINIAFNAVAQCSVDNILLEVE